MNTPTASPAATEGNLGISGDARRRAGAAAEKLMAHYLHREFGRDSEIHMVHGLRLIDADQPEPDGNVGVCQIDHLVIHRWGMFIVESKSVTEEIRVRSDGSGGDEWSRVYQDKETGIPSPIQQARRQARFLRTVLNRHCEDLLGKQAVGLRTLSKIVVGSDQRAFGAAPIQIVVAISDKGNIRRIDGWEEPKKPFRTFVAKADLAPQKIREEMARHRKAATLLNLNPVDDYGVWAMNGAETGHVAAFLTERHAGDAQGTRKPSRDGPTEERDQKDKKGKVPETGSTDPQCKHCGSEQLTGAWGKHGYYWRCSGCGKNTSMRAACEVCGADGGKRGKVRIRKEGPTYFRECGECGTSREIWTQR